MGDPPCELRGQCFREPWPPRRSRACRRVLPGHAGSSHLLEGGLDLADDAPEGLGSGGADGPDNSNAWRGWNCRSAAPAGRPACRRPAHRAASSCFLRCSLPKRFHRSRSRLVRAKSRLVAREVVAWRSPAGVTSIRMFRESCSRRGAPSNRPRLPLSLATLRVSAHAHPNLHTTSARIFLASTRYNQRPSKGR